jgi:tetratricopeptide (TPR) repeat protein
MTKRLLLITEVIRLNPNNAEAYNFRGNTNYHKNDFNTAIADFNRAIKLNQDKASGYHGRGDAYNRKGDYESAIADLSIAISLNPNDADSYLTRADAYSNKGDYDKAIADYNQAIRLKPSAHNLKSRGIKYFYKTLKLKLDDTETIEARDNALAAKESCRRLVRKAEIKIEKKRRFFIL